MRAVIDPVTDQVIFSDDGSGFGYCAFARSPEVECAERATHYIRLPAVEERINPMTGHVSFTRRRGSQVILVCAAHEYGRGAPIPIRRPSGAELVPIYRRNRIHGSTFIVHDDKSALTTNGIRPGGTSPLATSRLTTTPIGESCARGWASRTDARETRIEAIVRVGGSATPAKEAAEHAFDILAAYAIWKAGRSIGALMEQSNDPMVRRYGRDMVGRFEQSFLDEMQRFKPSVADAANVPGPRREEEPRVRCGCDRHDVDPRGDLYAQHREWVELVVDREAARSKLHVTERERAIALERVRPLLVPRVQVQHAEEPDGL
jgi:hypothetical protein